MKTNPLPFLLFFYGGIFLISAIFFSNLNDKPGQGVAFTLVFVGFGGLAYLLPAYISAFRRSPRFAAIFGLNLLSGWTFIGWLASLIWAFVDIKKESPQVIIQQVYSAPQQPPSIHPTNQ
jgi:hypothetical protein